MNLIQFFKQFLTLKNAKAPITSPIDKIMKIIKIKPFLVMEHGFSFSISDSGSFSACSFLLAWSITL
jgi:hypothetical protein